MLLGEFLIAHRQVANNSAAPKHAQNGRDRAAVRFETVAESGLVRGLLHAHRPRVALTVLAALLATSISLLLPLQFGFLASIHRLGSGEVMRVSA